MHFSAAPSRRAIVGYSYAGKMTRLSWGFVRPAGTHRTDRPRAQQQRRSRETRGSTRQSTEADRSVGRSRVSSYVLLVCVLQSTERERERVGKRVGPETSMCAVVVRPNADAAASRKPPGFVRDSCRSPIDLDRRLR